MKQFNIQKLQNKLRNKFLKSGVKMVGPETIYFSKDTQIGKNVVIEPYVVFGSKVKIGNNVTIKSFSHIENCIIENKVEIGPFARIRPGTILKEGSKIGNFVEIKNSKVAEHTKINHLSYVGDARIGKNTNIGAGTVTCNYDGVTKHRTVIGEDVFIGSNTMLIAPVTVGNNSMTGSGSVITKDIPADDLAISRSKQKNNNNGAKKLRKILRNKKNNETH